MVQVARSSSALQLLATGEDIGARLADAAEERDVPLQCETVGPASAVVLASSYWDGVSDYLLDCDLANETTLRPRDVILRFPRVRPLFFFFHSSFILVRVVPIFSDAIS